MTISLLVKKLIAGILALIMPITTATAVKQQTKTEAPKNDFHAAIRYDDPLPNIETEEDTIDYGAPESEVKGAPETEDPENNEPTDAQPTEGAPVENETNEIGMGESAQERARTYDYVAEWNVSATDEDDVHMYYYEENDDKFIDTITATVKALFVPITAYADELEEDALAERNIEDDGTIVISGKGATEEMLFIKLLDHNAFAAAYENWCAENDLADDAYVLRSEIDENGVVLGESLTAEAVRAEYDYLPEEAVSKAMLGKYVPVHIFEFYEENVETFRNDYLTVSPTKVVIGKDVTKVNFFAFAFLPDIEVVEIAENSNLQVIAAGAFAYTNIDTFTVPAATTYLGDSSFLGCENLDDIYINGILDACGSYAFADIYSDIRIHCEHIFTYCNVMGESTEGLDVTDNDYGYCESTVYYYGTSATVILDTSNYNQ